MGRRLMPARPPSRATAPVRETACCSTARCRSWLRMRAIRLPAIASRIGWSCAIAGLLALLALHECNVAADSNGAVSAIPTLPGLLARWIKRRRGRDVVALPQDSAAPTVPARIGKFPLRRLLGSGSMGAVYLGHDPSCDRPVAIKILRTTGLAWADHKQHAEDRFRAEARAVGRLNHRNIVSIYEFGEHDGVEFLVMEYVPGHNLSDYLQSGRPFDLPCVLCLMYQLLDALHYAHERRIVHRDIKPSNLMISPEGRLQITDFGIARDVGGSQVTRGDLVIGSPGHMAPEQYTNETIDRRTDVFAAGVFLYQLLTSNKPFSGNDQETMVQIVYGTHRPLTSASADPALLAFEPIVGRALAKSPAQRFATALEFREALEQLEMSIGVRVPPLLPAARLLPPPDAPDHGIESQPPRGRADDRTVLLRSDGVPSGAPPEPADATGDGPQRERFKVQFRRRLAWSDFSDLHDFLAKRWIYNEADMHALLFDESRCLVVDDQGGSLDRSRLEPVVLRIEQSLFASIQTVAGIEAYRARNGDAGRLNAIWRQQPPGAVRAGAPQVSAPAAALTVPSLQTRHFDAALLFPQALRFRVKRVVAELERLLDRDVFFYDSNFIAELSGPGADGVLRTVYSRAGLLVVFVAAGTQHDEWCGLDLATVRSLIEARAASSVWFVGFDELSTIELFGVDRFIDAKQVDPPDIAQRIRDGTVTASRRARG